MTNDYHEANRHSWNAATRQHNTHKGDQAAFFRKGGNTLFPEEITLLGDVRGKTLAHLQCNTGVDTLSIAAHRGADVTGIDISDEAITFAQTLSAESGIAGTFIRSDIFDWFNTNQTLFDVVFTSYGATCWISDLARWGRGIAAALKPGGHFAMMEFHPLLTMLDDDDPARIRYNYMGGTHLAFKGVGDYVGAQSGDSTNTGTTVIDAEHWENPHPSHEFAWGIGDHLSALLDAGLTITAFREYPYSNGWKPFPQLAEKEGRRMFSGEGLPIMPLMFGITAIKPLE